MRQRKKVEIASTTGEASSRLRDSVNHYKAQAELLQAQMRYTAREWQEQVDKMVPERFVLQMHNLPPPRTPSRIVERRGILETPERSQLTILKVPLANCTNILFL